MCTLRSVSIHFLCYARPELLARPKVCSSHRYCHTVGSEKSMESSKKKLAAVEKVVATALPMAVVLAVELAVLCSDESSAGQR